MFKTILIAAIALAGAQAIKISSKATSETSAEAFSSATEVPGFGGVALVEWAHEDSDQNTTG